MAINNEIEEKIKKVSLKDDSFVWNNDISYYANFCVNMLLRNRRKYGRL